MKKHRGHIDRFDDGGMVDPMSYVSNLSDIMLIFAVGVLLAVIVHWNVDVSGVADTLQDGEKIEAVDEEIQDPAESVEETEPVDADAAETVTAEEMDAMRQQAEPAFSSDGLKKTGEVYYDELTDTYYIVEQSGSADDYVLPEAQSVVPQTTDDEGVITFMDDEEDLYIADASDSDIG